jgi:hypothetical protein
MQLRLWWWVEDRGGCARPASKKNFTIRPRLAGHCTPLKCRRLKSIVASTSQQEKTNTTILGHARAGCRLTRPSQGQTITHQHRRCHISCHIELLHSVWLPANHDVMQVLRKAHGESRSSRWPSRREAAWIHAVVRPCTTGSRPSPEVVTRGWEDRKAPQISPWRKATEEILLCSAN